VTTSKSMADGGKVVTIRVEPVDFDLNEDWLQIRRWAAKRAGKASSGECTPEQLAAAIDIWRRTYPNWPPALDAT
jgi:hypothetical protein